MGACIANPVGARLALDELFTHSDGLSDKFFSELASMGVCLPKPPIRVVNLAPGPGEAPFSMEDAVRFAEQMSVLLPELLPMDGVFFYINSRLQGVVSAPEGEMTEKLYQALYELVHCFPAEQRPHAAISNVYENWSCISRACAENQEAHEFARFLDRTVDVIVQPRDFALYGAPMTEEDDDSFFGDVSQRICNAMLLGDKKLMHLALDEALDYMVGRFPRVSGVHMRAIHFCKPLEMSLVGADLIDRLFVQQFRLVQKVIETDREKELRETFHRVMDEIWDYSAQRKQLRHGQQMQRVAEYIQRNLTDSMLSITTIAQNFQVSEAKLSAAFRQYYQETIPNFIHRKRIACIKEQLRTTNTPIRIIALNAGYISLATMNRAFVRQEGIYPGQYRKENRRLPEQSEE